MQLEPSVVCDWVLVWVVVPVLLAGPLVALWIGVWVAVLLPPAVIEPPAMFTGMLTLTAFCGASADDSAVCVVFDSWQDSCAWPGPPQPKLQLEPLEVWLWVLLWVVVPVLLAGPLFALLVGVWVAVLLPPAVIE